ncbi:hypothetical protein [Streptomyces sp. NPDC004680]|uniref:hypothetical protein n=1 Tax=Streptomyces sp. NPDC004680 TaxID=3154287 RepID=UPI0033A52BE7
MLAGATPVLVHNCNTKVYRSPYKGNKEAEADGLNPDLHRGRNQMAYLGEKSVVTEHYAAQGPWEDGFYEYEMHPDFDTEFADYKMPHDGGDDFQWEVPLAKTPRFNELIINQSWVNYYAGYEYWARILSSSG